MATFETTHARSKQALDTFVEALSDEDLDTGGKEELMGKLVQAAGDATLGIWNELHRIADSLEEMANK